MGKEILTFGDMKIEKKIFFLPPKDSCHFKGRRNLESISI